MLLQFAQHDLGAGAELQAFVIHALQGAFFQSLQQRNAAAQAFGEIDLAAHGGFGDGRHLRLEMIHVGDFIDAFDGDQRGIHVHHHQAEVTQVPVRINKAVIELMLPAIHRDGIVRFCIAQAEGVRRSLLDAGSVRQFGKLVEACGRDIVGGLDDEVHDSSL